MRPFTLARVLELTERRAEGLSRTVKRAHGEWLHARGRQVQLAAVRDAHVEGLAGQLRAGVSTAQLQEANRLRQAQAAEIQAARAAIETAYQAWQARLAEWLEADQRLRALRRLEERYRAHVAVQQRRIEQREHDEFVERAHRGEAGGQVR